MICFKLRKKRLSKGKRGARRSGGDTRSKMVETVELSKSGAKLPTIKVTKPGKKDAGHKKLAATGPSLPELSTK